MSHCQLVVLQQGDTAGNPADVSDMNSEINLEMHEMHEIYMELSYGYDLQKGV